MCVCVSQAGRTEGRGGWRTEGIRADEEGKGRARQRAVMGSATEVRAVIHQ